MPTYRIPKHRKVAETIKMTNGNILTREVDDSGYSRWFRNGKYITPSVLKTYRFYDKSIGGYRQLENGKDLRMFDGKGINNATPVYTPTIDKIMNDASKYNKKQTELRRKQQYKSNGKYLTLKTKGNMNLVDIPTNMLDSIAINTGRSKTNIKTNLGLVGKESTFGGYSHFLNNPWSKNDIIDPHTLTNNHSYFIASGDGYIEALYKSIPGFLDKDKAARERKAKEDLKYHNGIPNSGRTPHYSPNLMADAFKRYAVSPSDYNPGQGNYIPMVNALGNEVWNEPQIQNWWNTEGKYYYNKGISQGINYTYANGGSLDNTLPKVIDVYPSEVTDNQYTEEGKLNAPNYWDDLSLSEKNDVMAAAVRNGITNLSDIRSKWNEFAEGGKTEDMDNPQALEGGHWSEATDGRDLFRMSEDGYRGPVSMDERQQYLIDNEPDGAVLEESNGALPVYDGTLWGGVLPNVDVYNNNTYEFGGFTDSNAVTGNRGTVSRVPHDAKYNHVVSIYKSFVNQGVDPQVALELTNQKVTEKGWNGWVSGDKKSYGNVNDFTKHVIEHYNKMYPDSMKANGFEQFYRGIEVSPKYKYNPYPARYRQQLLLTRPGVKKRVNEYRKTLGLGPLALQSAPTMPWDNNILVNPVQQQLMMQQPMQATMAADGGHLFKKGGSTDMASVRARQALSFFMNKGLSKAAASGLVGNLMRESNNLDPNAVNPHGGAYGLAQWLGPRQNKLFKLYGNHPTFDQQLDYIWRELNTTHKKGLQMLKASKTPEEAARNAFGYYEFSRGPEAAIASMNKNGKNTKWKNPDGYSAMMKGINNARKLSGQSPLPYDAPSYTPSYSPLFRSMFSSPVRRPLSFSEAMLSPAVSYEVPKVVLPVEEESKPEPAVGMSDADKADHFNALMSYSYLGMDNYLPTSSSYSKYALFGNTDNDNSMSGLMSLLGYNE